MFYSLRISNKAEKCGDVIATQKYKETWDKQKFSLHFSPINQRVQY